ncbi:MAG: hypothetical protein COT17_00035 [Elusimicrobia bacterium CG08_land_8_20_14_0_20_51_18]|nr:MAG: hypothetical protein COT17_00035 [Elusimicrobia bacterium CG08_land_8_20_14_0_20_51_18]
MKILLFLAFFFPSPAAAQDVPLPIRNFKAGTVPIRSDGANRDVPLKEKISQLIMVSADLNEAGKIEELVKAGVGAVQIQWGSFSLKDTKKFTDGIYAVSGGSTPFIAIDYEGGSVFHPATLGLIDLPTNMMLGAAKDPDNTASLFYLAGLELKKAGINMGLAPVVDVNTNNENPIIGIRSFSSDPELVALLGNSVVNGFKAAGIVPVLKHFPGHGDTSNDSHKILPSVNLSKEELLKIHVQPFKKIIDSGNAEVIMTSHILYPALDKKYPASLSPEIMNRFLREELNYKGVIITDSLDMRAITNSRSIASGAFLALKNGADMLLVGRGDFYKARDRIISEVKKGNMDISRINESYDRLMNLKKKYGVGEKKVSAGGFDMAYNEITRELSGKAITVLKDVKKALPLKPEHKISIIFFMPQRFSAQSMNLYRTLLDYGYKVTHYNFQINPDEGDLSKIKHITGTSDLVITGSFQWGSAQNKAQKRAIKEILKSSRQSVLISLMSPYDVRNYPEAETLILTYGITDFTMESLGDILSGAAEPRGVLPVSIKF